MSHYEWKVGIATDHQPIFENLAEVLTSIRFHDRSLGVFRFQSEPVSDNVRVPLLLIAHTHSGEIVATLEALRAQDIFLHTRVTILLHHLVTCPSEEILSRYDVSDIRLIDVLVPKMLQTLAEVAIHSYLSRREAGIMNAVLNVGQTLTGLAYLERMVGILAETMAHKIVFVGMVKENGDSLVDTLAVWKDGKLAPGFEYQLEGTPCQNVLSGKRVHTYPNDVHLLFPEDVLLDELGIRSYIGCPISDPSGKLLGILVALNDHPLELSGFFEPIIEFFAGRTGAELVRLQAMERMQKINDELEAKVKERTLELKHTHRQMLDVAHRAGMADIAIGILHNVGNLLNSVSISTEVIGETLSSSSLVLLNKVNALLESHADRLPFFLEEHPKGKHLPEFLRTLNMSLEEDQHTIATENELITQNTRMINQVIQTHQRHSYDQLMVEPCDLKEIVGQIEVLMRTTFERNKVRLEKHFEDLPNVMGQRTKIIQILNNLIKNSIEAMHDVAEHHRSIVVESRCSSEEVMIDIRDHGIGIEEKNLEKMFTFGFTTKEQGHGFGLHTSYIFMQQMGGNLTARSLGQGEGAVFTMVFPRVTEDRHQTQWIKHRSGVPSIEMGSGQ